MSPSTVIDLVRQHVRQHHLIQAGDRLVIAVSGGADSVALLRVMVELRHELAIVLSVAHFHHGIRGADADADRDFVCDLSARLGIELHLGSGDAPGHARTQHASLETAARDLRHAWFAELIAQDKADKIATAHTLDDQAETVLMRMVRGAGIHGLAGIFPVQQEKHLVRPLLAVTRREVESYLNSLGQSWREDLSNQDLTHTRNRVRHQLLPMLEREFNPAIRKVLADLAETARLESDYWEHETKTLLGRMLRQGKPSRSGRSTSQEASQTLSLEVAALTDLPPALERQLLHYLAREMGCTLEFVHVQQICQLAREGRAGKRLVLPRGLLVVRTFRELQFTIRQKDAGEGADGYRYPLRVPGEARVPELNSVIHARKIEVGEHESSAYSFGSLLNPKVLAEELIVRNWRSGDRFFPARTRAPKKIKELLQSGRLGRVVLPQERKLWPVLESAGQIVWVRGFAVPEAFAAAKGSAVLIEESQID